MDQCHLQTTIDCYLRPVFKMKTKIYSDLLNHPQN